MPDPADPIDARLSPLFTWRSAICESDLPSTSRHVALTLSLHMSERGDSCYPSVPTLARETDLARRTVQRHLRRLEDDGWLRPDGSSPVRTGGGEQRTTRYAATIPESVETTVPTGESGGGTGSPPGDEGGGTVSPPGGQGGGTGSPPARKGAAHDPQGGGTVSPKDVSEDDRTDAPDGSSDAAVPAALPSDDRILDPLRELWLLGEDVLSNGDRGPATAALVGAWVAHYESEYGTGPPEKRRSRQGAFAGQVLAEVPPRGAAIAFVGMTKLWEHREGGSPWDLADLRRKYDKAFAAGVRTIRSGGADPGSADERARSKAARIRAAIDEVEP